MPGIPGIIWPIDCVILRASTNRFTSSLTSRTSTPAPRAIRERREPLRMPTSARSPGVIDWMIASTRSTCFSSISEIAFMLEAPGSMPKTLDNGPILRICCIWARKSSSPNWPPPPISFSAAFADSSASNAFSACSMRVSMSPMPRMRLAIRSGWKMSKSLSFSPLDANMIGLPITRAIDSAAPPRASPSSLVSTTPSMPTPCSNASAVLTASWPIIASTTNRVSSGLVSALIICAWRIISVSTPNRPAVSMITTSKR
ncbi:hypothetical protein SDC9_145963 [bioreactor metagenome]|uniref:Uncharacterized protein n=1 Tax=bioreactor metagenome TaxID=1076179 RepID=A0A645EDF3_9ZZZZ